MTDPQDPSTPHTIDDGLPPDRSAWPDGVLDRMQSLAQGHVLRNPPLFYFADPAHPIWARTRAYTDGSVGPEVVEAGEEAVPAYGMITSQTCDVVEEMSDRPLRPWVQLSPVYNRSDLNSGLRILISAGKGPRYLFHVPQLPGGFWVADLRIEYPVEKGWVAGQEALDGLGSQALRMRLSERLGLLRSRPAFAQEFVDAVQRPLVEQLRALKATHKDLYERMDAQVDEVCVELDDHLSPTQGRVTLLLERPVDPDVLSWWNGWWDTASQAVEAVGFILHSFEARLATELRVSEYKRMTAVPLERLSPD